MNQSTQPSNYQTALFAAGCFWGVQAKFQKQFKPIISQVGYTGGHLQNPDYKSVCAGNSGHAEAIEIHFDLNQVDYNTLLTTFWQIHDPTQKNRQGPDIGSQYRSAIFYHNEQQKNIAQHSQKIAQTQLTKPIATVIEPATRFWPAEDYHQNYLAKKKSGFFF